MIEDYVDRYNRFHTKPIASDKEGLPTNNAYIYSFYADMLGLYSNIPHPDTPQPLRGFPRHPDGCSVPVSHDEYVGVAGMDKAAALRICHIGKKITYWQFCDLPNFEPKPFYKLNPFRAIRDLYNLSKEKDDQGKNNSRRSVIKYPYIHPICFWHRTSHQYFYVRCSGNNPSLFVVFGFIGSSLFNIVRRDSNVMLAMKLVKLKKLGYTSVEKVIAYLYKKRCSFIKGVRDEVSDVNCPIRIAAELLDADGSLNDKI